MISEERGREGRRRWGIGLALALGLGGCESLTRVTDFDLSFGTARPAVRHLEGSEIFLVATRFQGAPEELYTKGERFRLQISFDPALVDLKRLHSTRLWAQDRPGGPWKEAGSFPLEGSEAVATFVPPADGAYGLRVSAIHDNGREVLIPAPSDQPLVWLYVDREAPRVTWITPSPNAVVEPGHSVDLQWGVSEMRFGEVPARLEWSPDGGASWSAVEEVRPSRGMGSTRWRVPAAAAAGKKTLVRLTVWDLVGNRASAVLPLSVSGAAALAAGPWAPAKAPSSTPAPAREAGASPPSGEAATAGRTTAVLYREPGASRESGAGGSPSRKPGEPRIILRNLGEGTMLPGGSRRYLFFAVEGLDPRETKVDIDWREAPAEPWEEVARDVPAEAGKFLWLVPDVKAAEGRLRFTAIASGRSKSGEPGSGSRAGPSVAIVETAVAIQSLPAAATAAKASAAEPTRLEPALLETARAESARPEEASAPEAASAVEEVSPANNGQPGGSAKLIVESFEDAVVRGGDQRYILWRYEGPTGLKALIEASPDAGSTWVPVAEAAAGAGRALWMVPAENGMAIARVRVELPAAGLIEGRTRPVRVDASPPQLELGRVPDRVAGELRFPMAVTDPGGAGVEEVVAYVRPAGGSSAAWTRRPRERVTFGEGANQIVISVADLAEGSHELLLLARDRVGNGGEAPPASLAPLAAFNVDRTPVAIRASPTALPWVEGLTAAVQVEIDVADAVPPLWLEERTPAGWSEVLRWETLTAPEELLRFPIPIGRAEYQARFGIRDAVGNTSYAVVGPRPVERSLKLSPLGDGRLPARSNHSIVWKLHPALAEMARELKVVVSHQARDGGDWIQLYDNLPAASACVWSVPEADSAQHRLRVALLHRGAVVGEDRSEPFAISAPQAPKIDPQVVEINESSLYYSERAELQLEKYRSTRAQYEKWFAELTSGLKADSHGNLPAAELEKLPPDLRRQAAERQRNLGEAAEKIRENFSRALEIDARNYRAAYGLAQLLHRTAPDKTTEIVRCLERTVEIKLDHAAALNDLGACRILLGEYAQAEEPLRRALAVEDLAAYRYNLGLSLFHQKKAAEARGHFEAALAKGGSSVRAGEVYYYIVSTFIEEGQVDEARRRLAQYGQQIPGHLREPLAANLK